MTAGPPPGWYTQPDGRQQWWDGARWADAPSTAAPGAAPYGLVPVPPVPADSASAGWPPPPAVGPPAVFTPYVAAKSPAIALLASFFIPGLGSMLNGEVGKGVGILIGYIVSAILTIVLVGFVGMLAFWVWGMLDAYQGAQRWNARYGIVS